MLLSDQFENKSNTKSRKEARQLDEVRLSEVGRIYASETERVSFHFVIGPLVIASISVRESQP